MFSKVENIALLSLIQICEKYGPTFLMGSACQMDHW